MYSTYSILENKIFKRVKQRKKHAMYKYFIITNAWN